MNLERIAALYEAGRVKRLHTRATIAEHTVAAHVYGALVLAVELAALNDVRLDKVLLALLYHDAAEVATGDIPAPTRKASPVLAQALQKLERAWEQKMNLPLPSDLTPLEQALVRACDTLDLAFNVLYERMLGNTHPWTYDVFHNCFAYLEDQSHICGVQELKRFLSQSWKDA